MIPTTDPATLLAGGTLQDHLEASRKSTRGRKPRSTAPADPVQPVPVQPAPPTPSPSPLSALSAPASEDMETEAYMDESGRLAFRQVPRTPVRPAAPSLPVRVQDAVDIVIVRSDRYSEADAYRYRVLEFILRLLYLRFGTECRGGRYAYLVSGLPRVMGDAGALASAGITYDTLAGAATAPSVDGDPASGARRFYGALEAQGLADCIGFGPLLAWFNKMCLNYEVFE